MIDLKQLAVALRDLSDPEFQRRAWLASEGPVVSSFEEQVCQTFDDTGLSDALDAQQAPAEISARALAELRALAAAARRVDHSVPPDQLLLDPQVARVRAIASRALTLIGEESNA